VPGNCRNLRLNVRLEGITSEPVLLPVWIMAYRYRDQLFRVLINGQTGKLSGEAPFDWTKLWLLLGGLVLLLAIVLTIIGRRLYAGIATTRQRNLQPRRFPAASPRSAPPRRS
jgi:hypothetical protein